jgi:hypothetical protein
MALSASVEGQIETCNEQTQIISIEHGRFNVILHKTYTSGALYRVEGSDDEDKYESIIYLSHFEGQECKEYIRSIPTLLEKLFKVGECDVSIEDSNMICEFETDLMSVKLTLPKVMETQIEIMAKTISRHEKRISELEGGNNLFSSYNKKIGKLKEENRQLENMVKGLTGQMKALENTVLELKYGNEKKDEILDIPVKMLAGKWVGYWIITIASFGSSFMLQMRQHEQTMFEPSTLKWENGKFHWKILKQHNHRFDTMFRFDPKTNTVSMSNDDKTFHILKRAPPDEIFGRWIMKTPHEERTICINHDKDSFILVHGGSHTQTRGSHPSNIRRENEIFHWSVSTASNSPTYHYQFDSKNLNFIEEIDAWASTYTIFERSN